MGTGGTKIKIGPTTRRDLGVPDILDNSVYRLSDYLTLQEAVDTVPSGKILHIDHDEILTSTVIITNPITIVNQGYTISQTTLDASGFDVLCNDVTFDGIKLVGNNGNIPDTELTSNTDPSTRNKCGILAIGTIGNNIKNLKIKNCEISYFGIGIFIPFNEDFILDKCTINKVNKGVLFGTIWFGHFGDAHEYESDNSTSYKFTNNKITCTYGDLSYSRPFCGFFCSGRIECTGNTLRGGGMSFENLLIGMTYIGTGYAIFSKNNCDTGASFPSIVTDNVFDADLAPVGRGQQFNWWQAIEPANGSRVTGNTIKNFLNGVGFSIKDCVVSNNYFENCGRELKGNIIGGGGIIISQSPDGNGVDENAIITNNTFINTSDTGGTIQIIAINAPSVPYMSNYIIEGNIVRNASGPFIGMNFVKNVKIRNNYIYNASNSQTGVFHWPDGAIICANYADAFYENNTIINTLGASGISTAFMIPPSGTSTFGYNEVSGCKFGTFYDWRTFYFTLPENYTSQYYLENGIKIGYMRTHLGSPIGNVQPNWVGETILDNQNYALYMAYATVNANNWLKIS